MARSQCGIATLWQETALPVPVHAADRAGDRIEESKAKIVVMDRERRISANKHYNPILILWTMALRLQAINFLNYFSKAERLL